MDQTPKPRGAGELPEAAQSEPLQGNERWELILRIADSPPFRKSPRLRQFLLFVGELSLTGRAAEITEYEIGWKVFERGPKYNPSEDSIVRTAARQLRGKVKEYFETEGIHENLLLEIPKGGYVPLFTPREREIPSSGLNGVTEPEDLPARVVSPRWWRILAGALALVAIGSLASTYLFWKKVQEQRLQTAPSIVSTILSRGPQATRVVVGDFGVALMTMGRKRGFSVEEYANHSYTEVTPALGSGPIGRNLWSLFGSGQIVSYPDVAVAGAILRLSGQEGKKATIQNARQISARDLRFGNFILLSAPIASPWMTLFEDKLNFRYRLSFDDDSPIPITVFENLHPLPGEMPLYRPAATSPGFGVTYGLVARVPNPTGSGKVLLIYGLKYTGLEAAGEYATDPNFAADLARRLKVNNINEAPDFEVLIETFSLDAAPRYIKVAAVRRVGS